MAATSFKWGSSSTFGSSDTLQGAPSTPVIIYHLTFTADVVSFVSVTNQRNLQMILSTSVSSVIAYMKSIFLETFSEPSGVEIDLEVSNTLLTFIEYVSPYGGY